MGYRTTKSKIKVESSKTNSYTEFYYHTFRNILLVSIPLLILAALILGLSTSHSFAVGSGSSGTDNVQLVLSTSCTVNAVVTSEHTVSLNGGQLDNNVGNTKLSAFCNDNNGYSIYAVGSSGDIDGNTDLINTVNESYNIHTGVYNENNASNPSSWAMKLTAGTGTGIDPTTGGSVPTTPPTIINGFDNYSTIPNIYTQVAKRTSGTSMITDSDASGSYLNTTYQIYANSYQPAGTYNGKVKYVIVHPNSNHNTIPDLDTAFAAAGKMKVYEEGGNSYYAMQDMDTEICSMVANTGAGTATQLADTRDNNLYWVAKLDDDNCWMTQNLDFDISTNTILNSETTDLNVAYNSATGNYPEYNNGYTVNNNIIYWEPASSATTINFTGNTVTGWGNSNTAPYSANKTDSTETGHVSLGNYYNWTAAIASNNSASLTTSTYDNIANSPKNSICPKGWRLPTISNDNASNAGSTNEFARLNYLYNDSSATNIENLINQPLSFAKSSSIKNDGSFYSDFNAYWSSTPYSIISAYFFYFNQNTVSTAVTGGGYWPYKSYGFAIRCVAK